MEFFMQKSSKEFAAKEKLACPPSPLMKSVLISFRAWSQIGRYEFSVSQNGLTALFGI